MRHKDQFLLQVSQTSKNTEQERDNSESKYHAMRQENQFNNTRIQVLETELEELEEKLCDRETENFLFDWKLEILITPSINHHLIVVEGFEYPCAVFFNNVPLGRLTLLVLDASCSV